VKIVNAAALAGGDLHICQEAYPVAQKHLPGPKCGYSSSRNVARRAPLPTCLQVTPSNGKAIRNALTAGSKTLSIGEIIAMRSHGAPPLTLTCHPMPSAAGRRQQG